MNNNIDQILANAPELQEYEGLDETACSPSFGGHIPESWSMLKDSIYAAQEAIRAGIENTQDLLADHDVRLGRTTRSNRYTAERMEGEIRQMKAALDGLQNPNGCSYGESSPMAPHGARRQVDLSPENAQVEGPPTQNSTEANQ